ncbi:hypothetical protein AB0876_17735 [Mycobacterium sp. NPDC049093]
MSNKRYCPKCFAAVEVGEDDFLVLHYRTIASGKHRKCPGKKRGKKERPSAITVVSGGLPNSKRRR